MHCSILEKAINESPRIECVSLFPMFLNSRHAGRFISPWQGTRWSICSHKGERLSWCASEQWLESLGQVRDQESEKLFWVGCKCSQLWVWHRTDIEVEKSSTTDRKIWFSVIPPSYRWISQRTQHFTSLLMRASCIHCVFRIFAVSTLLNLSPPITLILSIAFSAASRHLRHLVLLQRTFRTRLHNLPFLPMRHSSAVVYLIASYVLAWLPLHCFHVLHQHWSLSDLPGMVRYRFQRTPFHLLCVLDAVDFFSPPVVQCSYIQWASNLPSFVDHIRPTGFGRWK